MNIDNLLILAAGHGTRMGKVGELLPKPLWPIFSMPLLKAQILFWKKFNPKRIFINVYHCGHLITEYVKTLNDPSIIVLEEDVLLGSGGPFYNVKKYLGNKLEKDELLWAVNADSLSNITSEIVTTISEKAKESHGVLVAQAFTESESYNRFVLSKGNLVDIKSKTLAIEAGEKRITFSGISCFNLNQMDDRDGVQSFFDSVANYKEKIISIVGPFDIETYDFGTIDNFVRGHLLLSNLVTSSSETSFVKELMKLNIIPEAKDIKKYSDAKMFEISKDYKLVPKNDTATSFSVTYNGYSSISLIQSTGQACSQS